MKNGTLKVKGTDAEVQGILKSVQERDKAAERSARSGVILVFAGLAGMVFLLYLRGQTPLAVGSELSWQEMVGYLSGCAVAVAIIVGLFKVGRGNAGDIDDARYEMVMRLHRFLSMDCDANAQFEYTVQLAPCDDARFYQRKERVGGIFGYPRGSVSYYQMPLLSGRARLRDGTSLLVQLDRSTSKKSVTKKNYRGKLKAKVKLKYCDVYRLRIKVPEDAPALPKSLDGTAIRGTSPPLQPVYKVDGVKADATLTRKGGSDSIPDLETLLNLLCAVFFAIYAERQRLQAAPSGVDALQHGGGV